MSGVLAAIGASRNNSDLAVTANSVIRVDNGFNDSGQVTTIQLPNTQVTGGVSPYGYNWARVSGSTALESIGELTPNPTWTALVTDGSPEEAEWELTVTDAAAAEATVTITITLIWNNLA